MSCGCTQLLEPNPPPEYGIGATNSPSAVEGDLTPLAQGVNIVSVTFTTAKLSAIYDFVELIVENVVDDQQMLINSTVNSRRTTGFTVLLDSLPDTPNYRLRWKVVVTQV